jgi:hypothetical protein
MAEFLFDNIFLLKLLNSGCKIHQDFKGGHENEIPVVFSKKVFK